MTTVIIILLLSITTMVVLLMAARGRGAAIKRVDELPQHTEPLDVQAFRNLMSPRDERFLRENLSGREYRRVQRLRLRAGIEYARRAKQRATILIQRSPAPPRSSPPMR
jgi:hypothetical protein